MTKEESQEQAIAAEHRDKTEPLLSRAMAHRMADWEVPTMPDWALTWFSDLSTKMVQGYNHIWNAITDVMGRIVMVNHWVQGVQTQGNTNTVRIHELEAKTRTLENWASQQDGYYDRLEECIRQLKAHIQYLQYRDVMGQIRWINAVLYENGMNTDG